MFNRLKISSMKIKDAREISLCPQKYSDDELRLAYLKLTNQALREFPSSPQQSRTRQEYSLIQEEIKRRRD